MLAFCLFSRSGISLSLVSRVYFKNYRYICSISNSLSSCNGMMCAATKSIVSCDVYVVPCSTYCIEIFLTPAARITLNYHEKYGHQ